MPKRDRDGQPAVSTSWCTGPDGCGWDAPVGVVDPEHDRHHVMAAIIRGEVRGDPPSYTQLQTWVKADEALLEQWRTRWTVERQRVLDLQAERDTTP